MHWRYSNLALSHRFDLPGIPNPWYWICAVCWPLIGKQFLHICWKNGPNWTPRNKLEWIFIQDPTLAFTNASENIVCEMAAILSRLQWVNRMSVSYPGELLSALYCRVVTRVLIPKMTLKSRSTMLGCKIVRLKQLSADFMMKKMIRWGNDQDPVYDINIDGLVQERRKSSALAMELRLSCTNLSI